MARAPPEVQVPRPTWRTHHPWQKARPAPLSTSNGKPFTPSPPRASDSNLAHFNPFDSLPPETRLQRKLSPSTSDFCAPSTARLASSTPSPRLSQHGHPQARAAVAVSRPRLPERPRSAFLRRPSTRLEQASLALRRGSRPRRRLLPSRQRRRPPPRRTPRRTRGKPNLGSRPGLSLFRGRPKITTPG